MIDGGSLRLPTLMQRPGSFQTIICSAFVVRTGRRWSDIAAAPESETMMPHAIIRGANGRRHEVDFGDAPARVEIYSSEETVEIFIEADFETLPEERPRHLFSLAKPPPPRHDGPESPSCTLDVTGDIGHHGLVPGPRGLYPAVKSMSTSYPGDTFRRHPPFNPSHRHKPGIPRLSNISETSQVFRCDGGKRSKTRVFLPVVTL